MKDQSIEALARAAGVLVERKPRMNLVPLADDEWDQLQHHRLQVGKTSSGKVSGRAFLEALERAHRERELRADGLQGELTGQAEADRQWGIQRPVQVYAVDDPMEPVGTELRERLGRSAVLPGRVVDALDGQA